MNRVALLAALDERLTQLGYRNPLVLPVDPFEIAEREGIFIEYSPIHDKQVAGILFNDGIDARVLLNSLTQQRWVFTLMHELIHFWFHPLTRDVYCDRQGSRSPWDIQANYCATDALMPAAAVRRVAAQLDYSVRYTAHFFGVSTEAMAIRFDELDLTKLIPKAYACKPIPIRMAAEESTPYRIHNDRHPLSSPPASDIAGVKLPIRKTLLRGGIA